MKRKLLGLLGVMFFTGLIALWLLPKSFQYSPELTVIMHAGGAVEDKLSSNSREALEASLLAGCRTVELDFNFSSDGYPVCIHEWSERFSDRITKNVPLSRDEFLVCEIYDKYTPMWADDVAWYMRRYKDLFIVTDVKDSNVTFAAYLAEHYPDLLDRFIIQIYQEDEYEPIRELGFTNIIFTLYRMSWEEKTDFEALGRFAEEHPIIAYTFDHTLLEMPFYPMGMETTGVPMLVHTVNDPELIRQYYAMGITGVYTDYYIKEPR